MMKAMFHFFTLVTKDDQYDAMRASLAAVGFDDSNSVFTMLDNRNGNAHEPFSSITTAVRDAQAPYIVFCHQDLEFYSGPEVLLEQIAKVEALDPRWAVLGNTGYQPGFDVAICLDDCSGLFDRGIRPAKVLSLDENFLLIRRDSGVGCSPGIAGFHLYATDLVLNAYERGYAAYVIDYRLMHKGSTLDYSGLHRLAWRFRKVWRGRIKGAVVATPSATLVFSRVPFLFHLTNRPGVHFPLIERVQYLRTLEYLLRFGRPSWLPFARFETTDPRGPVINRKVRLVDKLARLGRPTWPASLTAEAPPPVDVDAGARQEALKAAAEAKAGAHGT